MAGCPTATALDQEQRRRIAYFATSLALVMTITAIYHLGFAQYRHDGVGAPETGNTLISMPMLLSTNPIGSIADHMAMHVSAVAHLGRRAVPLEASGWLRRRANLPAP